MLVRRLVLGVCAAALLLPLGACSGSVDGDDIRSAAGSLTGVTVSGRPGSPPAVRIAAPLAVGETSAEVIVEGTGPPVTVDQLLVLHLAVYDAATGRKAISSYDEGQRPMAVKNTDGTLFPALSDALVGVHQGSRLLMALSAADGYGEAGAPQYGIEAGDPLVVVADVVAVPPEEVLEAATGDPVPPRPGAPVLRGEPPAGVQVGGLQRPARPVLITLVEGDGPAVRADSLVAVRSLSQVWGAPDPFDSSYAKEPVLVPIGVGAVVRAWDETLVGVRRGSRVMIVAPPSSAFGDAGSPPEVPPGATIVYVVDVLGVS